MRKIEKQISEIFCRFFWSPVSHIKPKNVKGGPLGVFEHPFLCKIGKNEGGPFGYMKKNKVSQSRNNLHKKNWSRAGLESTSFCLADFKKSSKSEAEATLVWQLVEASL